MRKTTGVYSLVIGLAVMLGLFLSGCSSEAARVQIQREGSFELAFNHDGSPVSLWTDLDIEYQHEPTLDYQITFKHDGQLLETVVCNPLDVGETKMARKATVRGVTKVSFLGEMNCNADLPEGEITAKVDLDLGGQDVKIFRADLVINRED